MLVVDRGGTAALAAVRALHAAGYEPVVLTVDPLSYAARSRFARRVLKNADDEPADAVVEAGPPQPQEPAPSASTYVQGLAWEGELVCACQQRVIRSWPLENGSPSYSESVELDTDVRDFIRGHSGPFGVRDGVSFEPWMSGSVALSIAAGHNVPALWADLLLGRDVDPPPPARTGVRLRVEEDDYRAILAGRDLGGLVPRRRTAHAVFSIRDPGPSRVTLAKLVSRRRRASAS